jgi:hypothetical protein
MIYSDSRYASGKVLVANDPRNGTFPTAVYRTFPSARAGFYYYTWTDGDRIDIVSYKLLGTPTSWWKIMDFNPEIVNPFSIPVGATLRIPSV